MVAPMFRTFTILYRQNEVVVVMCRGAIHSMWPLVLSVASPRGTAAILAFDSEQEYSWVHNRHCEIDRRLHSLPDAHSCCIVESRFPLPHLPA